MNPGVIIPIDTIVAPATPAGRGALSIVRVTGAASFDAVGSCIDRNITELKPGRIYRAAFLDSNGNVVDDMTLILYRKPRSYTGEDMAELFFHGGMLIIETALKTLMSKGLRAAEPGEFTKRAFLNGKMDLISAESIEALIDAPSRQSLFATTRLLSEGIESINSVIDRLEKLRTEMLAHIEFPEDDLPDFRLDEWQNLLKAEITQLSSLKERAERSSVLRSSPMVVLTGKPNAGKSSIFNAILREERAIVHSEPGTTRDFLEADIVHNGVTISIIDTAGIDKPLNALDELAMQRAEKLKEKAALTVEVHDSTSDREYQSSEKKIVVMNKTDISNPGEMENCIAVSARTGQGIETLLNTISDRLRPETGDYLQLSMRAQATLKTALANLSSTSANLDNEMFDIALDELEKGLQELYSVTGREFRQEIINDIFKDFCIGK